MAFPHLLWLAERWLPVSTLKREWRHASYWCSGPRFLLVLGAAFDALNLRCAVLHRRCVAGFGLHTLTLVTSMHCVGCFKCLGVGCPLLCWLKIQPVANKRHYGYLVSIYDCNWDSSALIYQVRSGYSAYQQSYQPCVSYKLFQKRTPTLDSVTTTIKNIPTFGSIPF